MIAVCLPQPWAGLVLTEQVRHINARRYTSYRGEVVIYAAGDTDATTDHYAHVQGLMDATHAYLGTVHVHDAQDPYQVDLNPYLGLGWWWIATPHEMMHEPVSADINHRWGDSFMVPDAHRDTLNAMRVGWDAWMDRYLEKLSSRNRRG